MYVYIGIFVAPRPVLDQSPPTVNSLIAEAMTYSRWGLSTQDAVAGKLHTPRHPPWHEAGTEEPLELLVQFGMVPPMTFCLWGTERAKGRHLKVASREALTTSFIILLQLPPNCIIIVHRTNSKPLFLVFKPGTIWSKFTSPALIFSVAHHSSVWHSNPTTYCIFSSLSVPISMVLFNFLVL